MHLRALLFSLVALALSGQNGSFPLESLTVKGTAFSSAMVKELGGLRLGAPVDKSAIDKACRRLQETGLFGTVEYQYATGPRHGYALTLKLEDSPAKIAAIIDIPGVNENAVWDWLSSQYPEFDHRVPEVESAQQFVAGRIQEHLAAELDGQHVAARLESDIKTRKNSIVYQPELLPQVVSLTFEHVAEFRSDRLESMVRKVMGSEGFSERRFGQYLDGVVRQAYEEHGMYRVSFPVTHVQKTGQFAVSVATEVSEGPKFNLGEVQLLGDNLPRDAMLKTASFPSGKLANWKDIQQGIYALERPVKRTGYFDAVAQTERILRDDQRILDLRIAMALGPMYHFGQIAFSGLPAAQEASARQMWKMQSGDPYDYAYLSDFLSEFSRTADLRGYKVRPQIHKASDHVMDETVIFEPK